MKWLLVRLDKSTASDPVVARRLHSILHGTNRRHAGQIRRALAQGPRGSLDAKAIKNGLGGLISQFAMALDCAVTAPQIGELFHRIERARTGLEIDEHIAASETLAKSV
jgi:hypothetical protein